MSATDPASVARNPSVIAATQLQSDASDPAASVWVSANAGSGKTHVLARRVIRLLLNGVPPGRILCLTYTKAAAANMANRVLGELRKWVSLDDAALDAALLATDGRSSDSARRRLARRLFANALETPGGLKIQTIHAFCGALLHRFPFEAGVPAGFGELEEAARLELLQRVRAQVVLNAAGRPDSEFGRALALLIGERSDAAIDALLAALIDQPALLATPPDLIDALVGRRAGDTIAGLAADIIDHAAVAPEAWRGTAAAMIDKGGNTARRGEALLEAAGATSGVALAYAGVFLKEDGSPYADTSFGKAEARSAFPWLLPERDRLADLVLRLKAVEAAERTEAALVLGREARRLYMSAKAARGVLDFTDLIAGARRLLNSGASAWVHFKLDQGIDHVLVDEAQDTSPDQWDVIRPLVSEFFAGKGARPTQRTLFVVGDEKQSIFSFQGADPRRFDEMRHAFERLAQHETFHHVRLQHSFRSAPGILGAVDTVFARPEAFSGLSGDTAGTHHEAIHALLPALVEIWDPETPGPAADLDAWQRPLDAPSDDDPAHRLARNIAQHIAARIATGFRVHGARGARPARAGDFLVLVRRRGALFDAVIRALKQARVPVAGADRLVVAEHIAVLDLMALGEALLTPDHELALACALKSPLFGFDDEDLIALCAGRSRPLVDELAARADENPKWFAANAALQRLRPEALSLRPFDFYARILGRDRGRARILARLGPEAADALDEMLALARGYERSGTPTLVGFLEFLRRGAVEAKRDMEAGRDEVRVMTVHGAKGLEAPYVVLADTTAGPRIGDEAGLLLAQTSTGANVAILAGNKRNDTPAITELRSRSEALAREEYRRLLYVALTRAESALVVCGANGRRPRPPDCWYDLVRGALESEAVASPATGFDGTVLRWRSAGLVEAAHAHASPAPPALSHEDDSWIARLSEVPRAMGDEARIVAPSRLDGPPEPVAVVDTALRRGALMHRLLAALPGLTDQVRLETGRRVLSHEAEDLEERDRETLLAETLAVIAHPRLAGLFSSTSRAEVAVSGQLDALQISGRIDRMAVMENRVIVADFKTDATPPARARTHHAAQLALYAALLEKLFPDKEIEALLVYTAGPIIHAVDADARRALLVAHSRSTPEP